jgi:hypothetical protein
MMVQRFIHVLHWNIFQVYSNFVYLLWYGRQFMIKYYLDLLLRQNASKKLWRQIKFWPTALFQFS